MGSVLVIRRRDNGKLACIGGFVGVGETLENAVRREVQEETGMKVTSLRMIPQVRKLKKSVCFSEEDKKTLKKKRTYVCFEALGVGFGVARLLCVRALYDGNAASVLKALSDVFRSGSSSLSPTRK